MSDERTLFQKIMDGDIPGDFVYEDDHCVVIRDIHPKAPVHCLVIPRKPIPRIMDLVPEDEQLMGHMIMVAQKVAAQEGCDGYRLQYNVGKKAGQEVFHLHLHIMGWK